MTDDDRENIAHIRKYGRLKNVCKVNVYEGTHPVTEEPIQVEIRDFGSGPGRFEIEARTMRLGKDLVASGFPQPTIPDALAGLAWEMLE